jgi:hypothetical protein
MRQEIGNLVHEFDAQLRIRDAGMDVGAADHHTPGQRLVGLGENTITLHLDRHLLVPDRPRMGGGGDHP